MSDGEEYSCPSCSWNGNEPKKIYWGPSETSIDYSGGRGLQDYGGGGGMPSGETVYCPECNAKIESRNYSGEGGPMTDFKKKFYGVVAALLAVFVYATKLGYV